MSHALGVALFLGTLSSDEFCLKKLDQMLAWNTYYGLSLPPPEAQLVLYTYTTKPRPRSLDDGDEAGLGFTLDGKTLWGPAPGEITSIKRVKPDPALMRGDVQGSWSDLALVAHKRGWKPVALAAIRRRAWQGTFREKWVLEQVKWDTEKDFASWAVGHWTNEISHAPDTPLSDIAKYLKRALSRSRLDDAFHREVLRSVERAVKPRDSAPGSEYALIDELINLSGDQRDDYFRRWRLTGVRADPRYLALLRRGLGAVPALIAHLDDDRITRLDPTVCGTYPRLPCVKDIVFDILSQLHGRRFETEGDTWQERLKPVSEWFTAAHKLGEEKYLVSHILGAEANDYILREAHLWLLKERYPERLPAVFREMIDTRPNQHCYAEDYAKAIVQAPVPEADVRKVFEYAVMHEEPWVASAGIAYLRLYNPKRAKERLLDRLATQPGYSFARVASEGTDPDEWKALGLAVRRANVALRVEMLSAVARADAPNGRAQRLSFLAEHLTDDEVWEDEDRTYSPRRRIEVRNVLAMRLAEVFRFDAEPDRDWTAAQWAALREQVRAKLKEQPK